MLLVERHDLGEDREGRVVYHHVGRFVLFPLVVALRDEGAHEVRLVQAVVLRHVVGHRLVDDRGRVAVVGGAFGLELSQELLILLVIFGKFARLHALLELPLPLLVFAHAVDRFGDGKVEGRQVQIDVFQFRRQFLEVPFGDLRGAIIHEAEGARLIFC